MRTKNQLLLSVSRADKTLSQLYGVSSVTAYVADQGTIECFVYLENGASFSCALINDNDLEHFANAVEDYSTSALSDRRYPINFEMSL